MKEDKDPKNKKEQPSIKRIILYSILAFIILVALGYINEWYL